MTDALLYEQDGSIVTLTMNRPDLRNPISEPDMIDAFEAAVHRINGDANGDGVGTDVHTLASPAVTRLQPPETAACTCKCQPFMPWVGSIADTLCRPSAFLVRCHHFPC